MRTIRWGMGVTGAAFAIAITLGVSVALAGPGYKEHDRKPTKSRTVTVSARASGSFGLGPDQSNSLPLVEALTVDHERTITIKYQSGSWCDGTGVCPGPNGHGSPTESWLHPLQQVYGVDASTLGALMGAFVPESLVDSRDFQALDGTKLTSGVGIMPNMLFFVGSHNVIQVSGPGTLYLGINDPGVFDNSGSITVLVEASR